MFNNGLGRVFYFLILVIVVLGSCANDDKKVLEQKYTIAYKSIQGVNKNLLSLDIYPAQSEQPAGLVIWVHGGGWSGGDKKNNIANKLSLFNGLGHCLVSVNYRLSSDTLAGARVKFPDHIEDLADAVAWVYENIEEYNCDKDKIVIMGHSAGAQLVALLASDASYLAQRNLSPSIFNGVMSLDTGTYDFVRLLENGDSQVAKNYSRVFGELAASQVSAINYLKNNNNLPKHWLFAERGSQDRRLILADFIKLLQDQESLVSKIDANTLSHGEVNRNIGAPNEKIMTDSVIEFLEIALK